MTIAALPVWPFEPNWSNNVTESLEWLTEILQSATGAEQRRAWRILPRKSVEFTVDLEGVDRSAFDLFMTAHGAHTLYLPLWYESYRSTGQAAAGQNVLPCIGANDRGILVGDVILIGGPRDCVLAEVQTISASGITLVSNLAKTWPQNTRIHPVRKARLAEQPSPRRLADNVISATVTFNIMESNDDVTPFVTLPVLNSYYVLSIEPDETDTLEYSFDRKIDELENNTALPVYGDTANFAFAGQKYTWILQGRAEYEAFVKLHYALMGRQRGLWVPTFFQDLVLAADTAPAGNTLTIENIGYVAAGGPFPGRRFIAIFMADGTQLYRQIMSAATSTGGKEVLALDAPFPSGLKADDVLRISFMQIGRLDQDRIEIVHVTDTHGISKCSATFRADPNLRVAMTGF